MEKIGQMFTQISERNATVAHITSVVRGKWGPGYVLVTADCLKIEESDGTTGWSSLKLIITATLNKLIMVLFTSI